MATDNKQEQWIDEVLAGTMGMEKAKAPNDLYDRVVDGLNKPKTIAGISFPLKQWVAAAVLLVAVNVASIVYFSMQGRPVGQGEDSLTGQLQLEQTYNYWR